MFIRETASGNMNQDEFQQMCERLGAEAARGLTNEQFMKLWSQVPLAKIEADLLVMRAAGGDAEAASRKEYSVSRAGSQLRDLVIGACP